MTTLALPALPSPTDFSVELRQQTAAVRLHTAALGTRRKLSKGQTAEAAAAFGASSDSVSAFKRLLDTKDPAYRAVTTLQSRATGLWRGMTVPYPEPGIRLIRKDRVGDFEDAARDLQSDLAPALDTLQGVYRELRDRAERDLGELFNASDYPDRIDGSFRIWWDFPSVEPPDYLRTLNPALWQRQHDLIAGQFSQAVGMLEQAFAAELAGMVEHLAERLGGDDDGKPKVFRDSAIENLRDFFGRFADLSIGSSAELEAVVQSAQDLVSGIDPKRLRRSADLREHVAQGMAGIRESLDDLMVDRPGRAIDLDDEEGGGL
ncbi:MAG: hypothetical protein IIB66_08575 [Proteobacteria bacterium]|nr:hypothetical protein [Pseudomonadota bacterium]